MNEFFEMTTRPETDLFFKKNDPADLRLGEIVSAQKEDYESAEIVILGVFSDENAAQNNDKSSADSIRREFYKLTNFGINRKIFDLGNVVLQNSANDDYAKKQQIVEKILQDKKRLIIIGGENNISYPCGAAVAKTLGNDRWLAINVDSHLDVETDENQDNGSSFRRLLEEKLLVPAYFYEIGFQPYFCSPNHFRYLQNLGVKTVSLEQMRSRESADLELRELIRQEFINHSRSMSIFFNFNMNTVRASDAPGVSAASPFGLRAGEFLTLVQFSAKLVNTKIISFTEVKPDLDVENTTSKLVAIAMHRFCSNASAA